MNENTENKTGFFIRFSCVKRILFLLVFLLGLFSGYVFYTLSYKCIDFQFRHHPFYGRLAYELKNELKKRGYLTNCPLVLPRSTVYFYNTSHISNTVYKLPTNMARSFAVLGDCEGYVNSLFLKKFSAVLTINEFQNGYLSTFNLRTTHFPLNPKQDLYCKKDFTSLNINIPLAAKQLDEIISGVLHEKF